MDDTGDNLRKRGVPNLWEQVEALQKEQRKGRMSDQGTTPRKRGRYRKNNAADPAMTSNSTSTTTAVDTTKKSNPPSTTPDASVDDATKSKPTTTNDAGGKGQVPSPPSAQVLEYASQVTKHAMDKRAEGQARLIQTTENMQKEHLTRQQDITMKLQKELIARQKEIDLQDLEEARALRAYAAGSLRADDASADDSKSRVIREV